MTVVLILVGTTLALSTTLVLRSVAPGVHRDVRLIVSYVMIVLPLTFAVREPVRFGLRRERLGIAVASGTVLGAAVLAFGRPSLFAAAPSAEQAATLGALAFVSVVEEAMFRGVLQSQFVAWLGRWRGVLAGAALFSLFHIPLLLLGGAALVDIVEKLGLIFVTGSALGLHMLAVRNIVGPAILHTAINWLG